MIYIINIDKQPSSNPSDDKREYEINIEELRIKGDIYDSIVITKNEDYVMRRLSLSEYNGLTVLNPPIKEPLTNINIELFEGDNYIYLTNRVGNKIYAEYLIKNEFNDLYVTVDTMNSAITQSANQIELSVNQTLEGYSTTQEMNSAIQLKANEINSVVSTKVGENEIISKINQSAETVGIQASKIKLEGYTTINGGFAVDKNGNASIANGTVKINSSGIQMSNNSSIVGGQGIYTNLYFPSLNFNWQDLGYYIAEAYTPDYAVIDIVAYIPSDFTISSAKIILQTYPVKWYYNTESQVGYPRNIRIYYEKSTTGQTVTPINIQLASEEYDHSYEWLSSNSGTLNATGTTNKLNVFTSSDLKNFLTSGQSTTFQLRTSNTPSSFTDSFFGTSDYSKARAARTGRGRAALVVVGYLSP